MMRRTIGIFTMLLVALVLSSCVESAELADMERYALLIGVNDYSNEPMLSDLPSPVKDMTDLRDALVKHLGFDQKNITLIVDTNPDSSKPTKGNIQAAVAGIVQNLPENAILFVAFSGHGVLIDRGNPDNHSSYLCVRDTSFAGATAEARLNTVIDRDALFAQIDKCKAKHKIFFVDACRNKMSDAEISQLATRSIKGFKVIENRITDPSQKGVYNYVLLSSCAPKEASIDVGKNGLFMKHLLEGLNSNKAARRDGKLTVFSWYDYAADQTIEESKKLIASNSVSLFKVNQTQQTPTICCPDEMRMLVLAKFEPFVPLPIPSVPSEPDPQLLTAGSSKTITVNGVDFVFKYCPAGKFDMGRYSSRPVTLTQDFWLLQNEVTQRQWKAVMGDGQNHSKFKGDDLPMETITWHESRSFCEKLSQLANRTIDLPTDAQWEYACRCGGGNVAANNNNGWSKINANGSTHPVCQKTANAWGLYDMVGNVSEWCIDGYDGLGDSPVTDPLIQPNNEHRRVQRGGHFKNSSKYANSYYRDADTPGDSYRWWGFRPLMKPVPED